MNAQKNIYAWVLVVYTTSILGSQTFEGAMDSQEPDAHSCQILLENTSPSPIWITTYQGIPTQMSLADLEKSTAITIAPYEIGQLNSSKIFTIYQRSRQSNTNYRPNLTLIQRLCDSSSEYAVKLSSIESGQIDPSRFIVVNHLKNGQVPEGMNNLCPGGLPAEWDEDTDQWLCKIHRFSTIYEKYVTEYVPVLSYIYQWLPSWMWAEWYTKHPHFYHWYHNHPEYYSHLEQYSAPWQTPEYKKIYDSLPEKERRELRAPESAEKSISQSKGIEPIGIPETNVTIKPHFQGICATPMVSATIMPHQPNSGRSAPKKQELHEAVSSEELKMNAHNETDTTKETMPSKYEARNYDHTIKKIKKPLAMINRGIITTQSGKRNISL